MDYEARLRSRVEELIDRLACEVERGLWSRWDGDGYCLAMGEDLKTFLGMDCVGLRFDEILRDPVEVEMMAAAIAAMRELPHLTNYGLLFNVGTPEEPVWLRGRATVVHAPTGVELRSECWNYSDIGSVRVPSSR